MFDELDESLNQAINEAGFEKPTQVQLETLEPALDGEPNEEFYEIWCGARKTNFKVRIDLIF